MAKKLTITFEIETERDDEGGEYVDYLRLKTLTTAGEVTVTDVRDVISYLENVEDAEYDTMFDVQSALRTHADRMEEMQAQQPS